MASKFWRDGDPSAPRTPWGPAQDAVDIAYGVRLFSTSGHGGLAVSPAVGKKKLSGAALNQALYFNGTYWFEEDVAIDIPLYEVDEWREAFGQRLGHPVSKEKAEKVIERYFPRYFEEVQSGHEGPDIPKLNDIFEVAKPLKFTTRDHQYNFEPGDKIQITKVTGNKLLFSPIQHKYSYLDFVLPMRDVLNGTIKKWKSPKVAAGYRWIPPELRNITPENPPGTNLLVYKTPTPNIRGKFTFAIFKGNQSKPLTYSITSSESVMDSAIQSEIDSNRSYLNSKKKMLEERKNFQHSLKEGDILVSSWGYDQTNIDFYEVIKLLDKQVVIKEIAKNIISSDGYGSDKVVPVPGHYIGTPMRKAVSSRNSVKISSYAYASLWSGKPVHQTSSGWGH